MRAVIDTNVLLVANNQHAEASPDCVSECVRVLQKMQSNGITVIDDSFLILREYQKRTQLQPPKGVGDVFLKWLLRNAGNTRHVEQVAITPTADDTFIEFPDSELQPIFDASDRKFAAVANAHPAKPVILQAVDCKWLNWWQALQTKGIRVAFLCPDDACRFYEKKFPDQVVPAIPERGQ
ncbi:hypothetical protein [Rhodoferax sp.]|uniref:hypothetical protein n=1 Tax=Rhodoferax sp. TaxID=50421 RepID=UPI002626A0FF|nr:hypothetical protein [Rhodoferax sp.]MDD2927134.1 hypothetical protein [Rhodoferax sp.]